MKNFVFIHASNIIRAQGCDCNSSTIGGYELNLKGPPISVAVYHRANVTFLKTVLLERSC